MIDESLFWDFQEDDILRKQISLQGTEKLVFNFDFWVMFLFYWVGWFWWKVLILFLLLWLIFSWAIIASKFNDKSTRQCRRRFGFVNSISRRLFSVVFLCVWSDYVGYWFVADGIHTWTLISREEVGPLKKIHFCVRLDFFFFLIT